MSKTFRHDDDTETRGKMKNWKKKCDDSSYHEVVSTSVLKSWAKSNVSRPFDSVRSDGIHKWGHEAWDSFEQIYIEKLDRNGHYQYKLMPDDLYIDKDGILQRVRGKSSS